MKKFLKVETKYNENLAGSQVVVVTLLSNINHTWDFIVDADAYHTLRLNEDYLVTTQDDWLGTIVGIRFETVANAINLKATVLKPVPVYDDQVEVLDTTEDDAEEDHQLDVEDKAAPLIAVQYLCDHKYTGIRGLTAKEVKNYNELHKKKLMSDDTEEDHQLLLEKYVTALKAKKERWLV